MSLFRRKSSRSLLKKNREIAEQRPEIRTMPKQHISPVQQQGNFIADSGTPNRASRRIFSLEDLVGRDEARNAMQETQLLELAAAQQTLRQTVDKLEIQLAKQDSYCKSLSKKMRADEQFFRKQLSTLQYKVDKYELYLQDSTSNLISENSYNSHNLALVSRSRYTSKHTSQLKLLTIPSPTPQSIDSITTRPASRKTPTDINKDQLEMANHPAVNWCAYFGDQKGFTCCLKSQKIVSAVQDYTDFLEKLESGKA